MRIEEAVRGVKHWVEKYDYCSNLQSGVSLRDGKTGKYVKFSMRTTRTRASSIVTRIQHIVRDAVPDRNFAVIKQLEGEEPDSRSSLASWTILVFLPLRVAREAA